MTFPLWPSNSAVIDVAVTHGTSVPTQDVIVLARDRPPSKPWRALAITQERLPAWALPT